MTRKLLETERTTLVAQHKQEKEKRICDRIKAVLLFDSDYSYSEIARILLLDDETIRRHVGDYFDNHKLAPENGGSGSYLSVEQQKLLIAHLKEKTYLYVKDICAYVRDTYKVEYTISGMTKWLKANKFCYKKPHCVPAKADATQQEAFKREYKELKSSLTNQDVLYFADTVHPQHQTQLAYGWIQRGERKAMKMTGYQKRIHILGAINLQGHSVEYCEVAKVNSGSFSDFLSQLVKANPEKTVHVILDNAGYHTSDEIKKFIEGKPIKLHYLPPYSPNLNPIERLWKIMHEQVTYNRYYPKFADFKEGILNFFKELPQYKAIITPRINDNFQQLTFA